MKTSEPTYNLASQGVYATIQGEGALMGLPSIFIRFAGCSIGCPQCDTNYKVVETVTLSSLRERVSRLLHGATTWAWLTGGEPTDQDLAPLVDALHSYGLLVALATAGTRPVQRGHLWGALDFVSVSVHGAEGWVQREGDQLNIVPGLNGLRLSDPGLLAALQACERGFQHKYVTPMMDREGRITNLAECLEWVRCRRGWRVGVQAHKTWRLP